MATDIKSLKLPPNSDSNKSSFYSFGKNIRDNIKNMRFSLMEFSGGLGDLGTFIPITAAMSFVTGMDLGLILIFAGMFNIITGILFGLPIPVQPMKAIAAVAIAEKLLPDEIAAAGLIAGCVIFILGVSGLVEKAGRVIPLAVVRGIQLGIGMKLMLKGIGLINQTPIFDWNSVITAISLGILTLYMRRFSRFPTALAIFTVGIVIMLIQSKAVLNNFYISMPAFITIIPDASAWINGCLFGAIPQLPLTLLNSVLAVSVLSSNLFPNRSVSMTKMAASVGLMNLLACPFGAMPMCHGSGGLAGQYHFGARTGGSVVMLGTGKLLIGLLFGTAVMSIIGLYPESILGIMLFFAGLELSTPARDQNRTGPFVIMIAVAAGIIIINTLAGFLIGMVIAAILKR